MNPSADDLDLELERFERKLAAGARFAMTQALFDLEYLDVFLSRFGGRPPVPVLVGVWPLRSHALAVRLHNEVPGIVVPERVQEALRRAGPGAAEVGLELARDLLAESREKVGRDLRRSRRSGSPKPRSSCSSTSRGYRTQGPVETGRCRRRRARGGRIAAGTP